MKFSPDLQRPRSPFGGDGVVAAIAVAIGLVALMACSTFSPSLPPAGGNSAGATAGASASAGALAAGGMVSYPQAASAACATSIVNLIVFIAIPDKRSTRTPARTDLVDGGKDWAIRRREIGRWSRKHLAAGAHVRSDGLRCFAAVKQAGCTHEPLASSCC